MTRTAHIKRDRQERFNLKRGWVVTAWRLVNAKGRHVYVAVLTGVVRALESLPV